MTGVEFLIILTGLVTALTAGKLCHVHLVNLRRTQEWRQAFFDEAAILIDSGRLSEEELR